MMEGLQITIPRRLQLLRVVLVSALVVSVVLSGRLWAGERRFPLSPVLDTGPVLQPYDLILPVFYCLFLLSSLLLRIPRTLIFLGFSLAVVMVLFDLERLQPWFAIYNLLLFVLMFYNGRVDDSNKFTSYFILLQLIVAAVYFFTGLEFLVLHPIEREVEAIIQPLEGLLSPRQFDLFIQLSVVFPYLLVFIGLSFVITPMRYLAISLSVLLHCSLLIFLFPSSGQPLYALWFSNLVFLVLIFLLFSGKTKQRYFSPLFVFQRPVFYLVLLVCMLLPALRLTGEQSVPRYLTFSFTCPEAAEIRVQGELIPRMPAYERELYKFGDRGYIMRLQDWTGQELHSVYVQHRIIQQNVIDHVVRNANTSANKIEFLLSDDQHRLFKRGSNFIFAGNLRTR